MIVSNYRFRLACAAAAFALSAACSAPPAETGEAPARGEAPAPPVDTAEAGGANSQASAIASNPLRDVFFGDLHIHTRNSFDAYIFGVRATPDDAYRYAKGQPISHPSGFTMQLQGPPLDFAAVTDHGAYLGVIRSIDTPGSPYADLEYADDLVSADPELIGQAFRRFGVSLAEGEVLEEFDNSPVIRTAWSENVASANRHYAPGEFTSFIAYEFTSAPDGLNLHRNVIFEGDDAPERPFHALISQDPEDLWRWLEDQREMGRDAIAIPHNSNGSNGAMFDRMTLSGEPIDAEYAIARMRNEPLVEITQVKGTSETHPLLSPNDEFAGFEIFDYAIGSTERITEFEGGYARDALMTGLEMEQNEGFNPYRFGFIGSSDTHNGAGSYYEDDYFSKIGIVDGEPSGRGSAPPPGQDWDDYTPTESQIRRGNWGASGLTGVWAESNTREAIFRSLRRKEVFATTGPRIRVRFFAGYDLEGVDLTADRGVRTAYDNGVPMGGELLARPGEPPELVIAAVQDPLSAPLQRIQVVKAWVDEDGEARERIFDVACSDRLEPDPETHRCPDNGAEVDISTCETRRGPGDVELRATWRDPDFNAEHHAIYYVRVLENPKCRWSTWDAIRAGVEPYPDYPATLQDRAYTSPVWVLPQ